MWRYFFFWTKEDACISIPDSNCHNMQIFWQRLQICWAIKDSLCKVVSTPVFLSCDDFTAINHQRNPSAAAYRHEHLVAPESISTHHDRETDDNAPSQPSHIWVDPVIWVLWISWYFHRRNIYLYIHVKELVYSEHNEQNSFMPLIDESDNALFLCSRRNPSFVHCSVHGYGFAYRWLWFLFDGTR